MRSVANAGQQILRFRQTKAMGCEEMPPDGPLTTIAVTCITAMKSFISPLICTLVCISFGCLGISAESGNSPISAMEVLLQTDDLSDFLQTVRSKDWKPPLIHSAWYVQNRIPKEKALEDVANRSLGKLILDKISASAVSLIASEDANVIEGTSKTLFDLSVWIEGQEGYGNLLLGARARDVATVGVGKLLVRLDFPIEKCGAFVAMLVEPSTAVRARVLNDEVGVEIFPRDTHEGLEHVWRSGSVLLLEQKSPWLKAARLGNPPKGMEDLSKMMQGVKPPIIESPQLSQNLDFFDDYRIGRQSEALTLANTWEKKRHFVIVNGLQSENAAGLRALLAFRSRVGFFPTAPVKNPFYKGGEASFDNAWRPQAAQDEKNLGLVAWRAFEAIQKGTFVDSDSKRHR